MSWYLSLFIILLFLFFFLYQNLEFIEELEVVEPEIPPFQLENSSFLRQLELNLSHPLLFPMTRWNHMPLKVYLNLESCENECMFCKSDIKYVRRGLEIWEEKTNGTILFEEVENESEADIVIGWVREVNQTEEAVGECRPRVVNTGLFSLIEHADILIVCKGLFSCSKPIRVLHEVGHALGLAHTKEKKSIMYPNEKCYQTITPEIIDTIEKLYSIEVKPELHFQNYSIRLGGREFTIKLLIKNAGLIPANSSILVKMDSIVQEFELPELKPGEGVEEIVKGTLPHKKLNYVIVRIDPGNRVDEIYEDNNELKIELQPPSV